MLFNTEKGFCVSPQSKYFEDFPWKPEHYYNENIVSRRPWIANAVLGTIEACSEIMFALASEIRFPDPIAPGHLVFIRDPSNEALIRLLNVHQGRLVWWGEDAEAKVGDEPSGDGATQSILPTQS